MVTTMTIINPTGIYIAMYGTVPSVFVGGGLGVELNTVLMEAIGFCDLRVADNSSDSKRQGKKSPLICLSLRWCMYLAIKSTALHPYLELNFLPSLLRSLGFSWLLVVGHSSVDIRKKECLH